MCDYFVTSDETSRHTLFPGVRIETMAGRQVMLSLVIMEPGAIVPPHSHPHEQAGLLLEGELHFRVGDRRRTLHPGDLWRIPGGVEHEVTAGAEGARALDVFHPVREDYL